MLIQVLVQKKKEKDKKNLQQVFHILIVGRYQFEVRSLSPGFKFMLWQLLLQSGSHQSLLQPLRLQDAA